MNGHLYDVRQIRGMWFFQMSGEKQLGWTAASAGTCREIEQQLSACGCPEEAENE